MKRMVVFVTFVLLGIACRRLAWAEERKYALVIGHNGAPTTIAANPLAPLRFADDDALAFYELVRELGAEATILTAPDADTRRRYPDSVDAAQPPTLAALERAVDRIGAEIGADARAGRTSAFFFFYSGHGSRSADGEAALTLFDGLLSRRMLYERVLDRAPADVIHLLVDACHAESVVGSRDGNAKAVLLTPDDIAAYVSQTTLAHYPNLGFAIASTRDGVSHEWDVYQSGVFTHEVISGLRGAADVNGDGRIEYSELDAFLAAANREVRDPRARLQAIVKAPVAAPRAPLADLTRANGVARLTNIPAAPQPFSIEDDVGRRLVDGRPELGFSVSISLPAARRLFLRRGEREAQLVLQPGVDLEFDELTFHAAPTRARDALDSSLREGLFLAQFGPAYYRGYVDRPDAAPVPIALDERVFAEPNLDSSRRRKKSPLPFWLGGAAAAMVVSSGVFAGMAWSAWRDNTNAVERDSVDAGSRFRLATGLSAGFVLSGVACATAAFLITNDP